MADAIVVLNAGSSSIKFSLFLDKGGELEPRLNGLLEGLYTAPRFTAKDASGTSLGEKKWGEGARLGHDGAIAHLVEFLGAQRAEQRPPEVHLAERHTVELQINQQRLGDQTEAVRAAG